MIQSLLLFSSTPLKSILNLFSQYKHFSLEKYMGTHFPTTAQTFLLSNQSCFPQYHLRSLSTSQKSSTSQDFYSYYAIVSIINISISISEQATCQMIIDSDCL